MTTKRTLLAALLAVGIWACSDYNEAAVDLAVSQAPSLDRGARRDSLPLDSVLRDQGMRRDARWR